MINEEHHKARSLDSLILTSVLVTTLCVAVFLITFTIVNNVKNSEIAKVYSSHIVFTNN